jgi:peroxiredoxin
MFMAATADPLQRGFAAPDFSLPGVDGRTWSLADVRGPRGTLVMFICNHCPYVQAVADRIRRDTDELRTLLIRHNED